jgi:hypothetical protein
VGLLAMVVSKVKWDLFFNKKHLKNIPIVPYGPNISLLSLSWPVMCRHHCCVCDATYSDAAMPTSSWQTVINVV